MLLDNYCESQWQETLNTAVKHLKQNNNVNRRPVTSQNCFILSSIYDENNNKHKTISRISNT